MKNREKEQLSIDEIDRNELKDAIELISGIKEIEWNGPVTKEKDKAGNDVIVLPFPIYPKGLFEALNIAGVDVHYAENYENNCEGVPIRDMGLSQIRTMLTRMQRGEHFCDGFIADEIENGNLLALLKRLDKIVEAEHDGRKDKLLDKAIAFATKKHAGQMRKGTNIPYIVHPMEVLSILAAMHAGKDVMIAGVLHDTVEDTDATITDIKTRFGVYIACLVAGHTEDKSKTWEECKEHALEELEIAPYELKCLVFADKLSNMRAIARDYRDLGDKVFERFNRPKEKQSWYYSKSIDALDEMMNYPETGEFYWELNELYKEVFVHFYYDESSYMLWQKAVGEKTYYFQKGSSIWNEWGGDITGSAREIPLEMAERIEDNWNEELEKINS